MADEIKAPGWEALSKRLYEIYPGQKPFHFSPTKHFDEGGKDPLDGISIFTGESPLSFWHYVSYGLSELYQKETKFPNTSGFGIEFSFRLKKDSDTAPLWPLTVLQNLAKHVVDTGKPFKEFQLVHSGELSPDSKTELKGLIFFVDPKLGTLETPHGKVTYMQVVGLTLKEMKYALKHAEELKKKLASKNELFVIDLTRKTTVS